MLSAIIFLFVAQTIPLNQAITPLVSGILWALGITSGYFAIKHLGITRAIGLWIPIVIITSALWGLIFFGEAKALGAGKLTITTLGISLLILAALAVVFSSQKEEKLGNIKLGIIGAIILGVVHGSFFVPIRNSSLSMYVTFLPLTIGMVLATSAISIGKKLKLSYGPFTVFRMILAGLILGGGNYTALLTIKYLGVAQGYPLTQLAIIVNTLWGALVFKEVTTTRGKVLIAAGVAIAIAGAFILNSARV